MPGSSFHSGSVKNETTKQQPSLKDPSISPSLKAVQGELSLPPRGEEKAELELQMSPVAMLMCGPNQGVFERLQDSSPCGKNFGPHGGINFK